MRAWFAAGSWAVALCALGLAIGSPARSAAQATDESAEAAEAEAPADGTTPATPPAPDAPVSDAAASESDDAAEPDAPDTESGEQPDGEGAVDGASELGSGSTALSPGDVEAEEAAAEGTAAVDDEAAAEEQQAAREPLPWRNTFFSWTHGVTPNTFDRGAQLSYNPTYYWSFNLAPRWYLDAQTFFFVSQSLSYELTDDDSSVNNHEPLLSDTIVELRRVAVAEGFIFIPAVRVVLPLSKVSQAAQRYFSLGAGLTAVRVIPEAASLTIAAIGRYQYSFAGRNTPVLQGSVPGDTAPSEPPPTPIGTVPGAAGVDIGSFNDQASGGTTARHTITAGLSLSITPVSGLTVSASAFFLAMESHGVARACTEVETSSSGWDCQGDDSRTRWRPFTSYSLSVAYDILPWFNLSVGWSNSTVLAPVLNDDGSVRSPFNPDNNLFLSASFQIDGIYEALVGAEDDGLTPEQRQRRRQGLSRRISGEEGSF